MEYGQLDETAWLDYDSWQLLSDSKSERDVSNLNVAREIDIGDQEFEKLSLWS